MSTTITVSRRTKRLLEAVKARFEEELGRKLTWDEFLGGVVLRKLGVRGSLLELSDEEAEVVLRLVREGRRSWGRYA